MDDQEYAAAESMVQHSRSARSNSQAFNGYAMPDVQAYSLQGSQAQSQMNSMPTVPLPPYRPFRQTFNPGNSQEQPQGYGVPFDGKLPPPRELQGHFDKQGKDSLPDLSHHRGSDTSSKDYHRSFPGHNGRGQRDSGSIDDSEPTSPVSVRGLGKRESDEHGGWTHRSRNDAGGQHDSKDQTPKKPAWSELKTKAGKERKRLPLACIACRRKKIRCSGEKPSCKHCMRSRIPCVYKVTQRKAAPRTDYMAMLDKRLKRMEERVIKIIPKDEMAQPAAIPRAVIKPAASAQANIGRKRGAEEAGLDEWVASKTNPLALKGRDSSGSKVNTEGAEFLPSAEIQEHLSEVFFDNLYGQSYHVLHKPSYMRRLKYVCYFNPEFCFQKADRTLELVVYLPCLSLQCALFLRDFQLTQSSKVIPPSSEARTGHVRLEAFL